MFSEHIVDTSLLLYSCRFGLFDVLSKRFWVFLLVLCGGGIKVREIFAFHENVDFYWISELGIEAEVFRERSQLD